MEVEGFRALRHVELDFPEANPGWSVEHLGNDAQEPWLVLLGNNGIGKSSLLKAVALALASPAERKRLVPRSAELVTRGRGRRSGRVRLWFSSRDKPVEWIFGSAAKRQREVAFRRPPVLAYGSTRLLPSSTGARRLAKPRLERIGNLFSPTEPLSDAEK